MSYYIDRKQLIEVGYLGANTPSQLPLPPYPPLLPYFDAIKDLLAKYDTNEFAPKKADGVLAGKGFKKDGEGYWSDGQGKRLSVNIIGFGASGPATGPVLVEMLKRREVEAGMSLPPDFDSRFQKGEYDGAIYAHGGSVNEPYATMRLYQGASIAVPGAHQANFARWKNGELRQAGRRSLCHGTGRHQEADRRLAACNGDLAARTARYPAGAELSPHSMEHDLQEELADQGERLCQWRSLAPDLSDGAVELAAGLRFTGILRDWVVKEPVIEPRTAPARGLLAKTLCCGHLRAKRGKLDFRQRRAVASDAAPLYRSPLWCLSAYRLARRHPQFFSAALVGSGPGAAKLMQQAALGGYVQAGIEEMTREYERRFGLDKPL